MILGPKRRMKRLGPSEKSVPQVVTNSGENRSKRPLATKPLFVISKGNAEQLDCRRLSSWFAATCDLVLPVDQKILHPSLLVSNQHPCWFDQAKLIASSANATSPIQGNLRYFSISRVNTHNQLFNIYSRYAGANGAGQFIVDGSG